MAMLMEEYDECWAAAKTNTKAPLNVPSVEAKGECEGESVGERRCKGAGGEAEAKQREERPRKSRSRRRKEESQKPEVRAGAGERAGAFKLGQEHRQERGQAQMQA
ncbi:hypothetical protein CFAM422_001198 [Trichoderma lentiforme]|uniref:Uncharacterized protein n=1 Tax=Trichoderma lentiforme TaxID=1567552 RepID=A0A9P4XPP1_9HYPO|nr:hypothetical protein CFAM422_001198 [Trichoderma lentiforme]